MTPEKNVETHEKQTKTTIISSIVLALLLITAYVMLHAALLGTGIKVATHNKNLVENRKDTVKQLYGEDAIKVSEDARGFKDVRYVVELKDGSVIEYTFETGDDTYPIYSAKRK